MHWVLAISTNHCSMEGEVDVFPNRGKKNVYAVWERLNINRRVAFGVSRRATEVDSWIALRTAIQKTLNRGHPQQLRITVPFSLSQWQQTLGAKGYYLWRSTHTRYHCDISLKLVSSAMDAITALCIR